MDYNFALRHDESDSTMTKVIHRETDSRSTRLSSNYGLHYINKSVTWISIGKELNLIGQMKVIRVARAYITSRLESIQIPAMEYHNLNKMIQEKKKILFVKASLTFILFLQGSYVQWNRFGLNKFHIVTDSTRKELIYHLSTSNKL